MKPIPHRQACPLERVVLCWGHSEEECETHFRHTVLQAKLRQAANVSHIRLTLDQRLGRAEVADFQGVRMTSMRLPKRSGTPLSQTFVGLQAKHVFDLNMATALSLAPSTSRFWGLMSLWQMPHRMDIRLSVGRSFIDFIVPMPG